MSQRQWQIVFSRARFRGRSHSNGSGDYSFTLLPVGHYTITVKAGGFRALITKDLAVEAGDRARADVHLQAGSENTVIEVSAGTPLLQADGATVSSTVTAKAVQDLPLSGRNFVQLVQLIPGATEGPGKRHTAFFCWQIRHLPQQ
jgi:hypothetical protein